jgi:hypothetical protein
MVFRIRRRVGGLRELEPDRGSEDRDYWAASTSASASLQLILLSCVLHVSPLAVGLPYSNGVLSIGTRIKPPGSQIVVWIASLFDGTDTLRIGPWLLKP